MHFIFLTHLIEIVLQIMTDSDSELTKENKIEKINKFFEINKDIVEKLKIKDPDSIKEIREKVRGFCHG